ncbi:MAG: hypothetical protein ACD_62C00170G0031 [uncultured bacterium]|nr:MAG: hypothetical protein ACD_62C00170G0031 [uncultured bacterium]
MLRFRSLAIFVGVTMSICSKKVFILCLVVLFSFLFVNCDSNSVNNDDVNPNVSAVTDDVATNVGPVDLLVSTDVLAKVNTIRGKLEDYIAEVTGSYDEPGAYNQVKFSINPGGDEQSVTIDLSEDIDCTTAGTKNIIGSATFTLGASQNSGTLVGSFVIQYSSCQDIIVLETESGTCAITPTVTGELQTDINLEYVLGGNDVSGQGISDTTEVSSGTSVALDVSVGSTAADQSYSFTYYLSTSLSSDGLDGIVSYSGNSYDMGDVESYIENSATTAVCE